jgi:hypothetical protein
LTHDLTQLLQIGLAAGAGRILNLSVMPFRHVPPGQFDFDTLKLMQQAYDAVCEKLKLDASDPRRVEFATAIIAAAADGERNRLAARAEQALARNAPR